MMYNLIHQLFPQKKKKIQTRILFILMSFLIVNVFKATLCDKLFHTLAPEFYPKLHIF